MLHASQYDQHQHVNAGSAEPGSSAQRPPGRIRETRRHRDELRPATTHNQGLGRHAEHGQPRPRISAEPLRPGAGTPQDHEFVESGRTRIRLCHNPIRQFALNVPCSRGRSPTSCFRTSLRSSWAPYCSFLASAGCSGRSDTAIPRPALRRLRYPCAAREARMPRAQAPARLRQGRRFRRRRGRTPAPSPRGSRPRRRVRRSP